MAAAVAARLAVPGVTVQAHRRQADKLMIRLEQLCANDHINWAFVAAAGRLRLFEPPSQRTVH